eukprot:COSAG04_NODE_3184_length_3078_cov_2.507553_1_plen_185_part_00
MLGFFYTRDMECVGQVVAVLEETSIAGLHAQSQRMYSVQNVGAFDETTRGKRWTLFNACEEDSAGKSLPKDYVFEPLSLKVAMREGSQRWKSEWSRNGVVDEDGNSAAADGDESALLGGASGNDSDADDDDSDEDYNGDEDLEPKESWIGRRKKAKRKGAGTEFAKRRKRRRSPSTESPSEEYE